jgi:hypothetical protein
VWKCEGRGHVHNKADGHGKYHWYKCDDCGILRKRYLKQKAA